ncbi:MAG: hypothetical protein HY547_10310, partial [Elusimicrobia bacterium]|nr:hypothetical protein [Elusimicrobiota bacterium]
MRKFLLIFSFGFLASCSSGIKTVKSKDFDPSQPLRVAVLKLKGPDLEVAQAIPDSLVPDLMEMNFAVIERSQLEKIMREQNLQFTGMLDMNTVREIGRIAGVDALMLGDFTIKQREAVEHRMINPGEPQHPPHW